MRQGAGIHAPPWATKGSMTSAKGSVLLVEDDERERKALARALRSAAFTVEEAASSREALEALDHQAFDVILTKLDLPGSSGLALLSAVRERTADVAVVLMTALPTVDTAVDALRAGAADYIVKPVKPELLFERLHAAAKTQRVRGALLHANERALAFARSVQQLHFALAASEDSTLPPAEPRLSSSPLGGLTPREREIASLIASGNVVGDIAAQLKLSPNTVRNHVKSIFAKLNVHSQLELVSRLARSTTIAIEPQLRSSDSPVAVVKEGEFPRPRREAR
jgi:DNA-binding NarL/FixJ family response regulator